MENSDVLGRRRTTEQNRGLRPLFPKLPASMESRVVRVAMSRSSWLHLDAILERSTSATRPRARGRLIEGWLFSESMEQMPSATEAGAWQDWQIRKELALLDAPHTFGGSTAQADGLN
jgi:hypothetical protein